MISSLGSVAGHTYERAAQPISIEDRAECRIGGSFLADDFKKLCEFGCRLMEELGWATAPLDLFRAWFSDPYGCAVFFRAC